MRIMLDVVNSKIPSDECGYEVHWSLSEELGHLENTDSWTNIVYVAPDNYPDGEMNAVHKITATMHYSSEYNSGSASVDIEIIRVPVLMVHGLNSDAMCFWELQRYLEQSGQYQSFQLFRADYEPTNCSYFRVNERVVQRGISILKRACAFNGYMIDKVDLVGHSMGGILSRLHVQYVDNTNVHKVITLNTPHTGSPLGSLAVVILVMFPKF